MGAVVKLQKLRTRLWTLTKLEKPLPLHKQDKDREGKRENISAVVAYLDQQNVTVFNQTCGNVNFQCDLQGHRCCSSILTYSSWQSQRGRTCTKKETERNREKTEGLLMHSRCPLLISPERGQPSSTIWGSGLVNTAKQPKILPLHTDPFKEATVREE